MSRYLSRPGFILSLILRHYLTQVGSTNTSWVSAAAGNSWVFWTGSGSTSLLDMCTASGGGPLKQPSLLSALLPCQALLHIVYYISVPYHPCASDVWDGEALKRRAARHKTSRVQWHTRSTRFAVWKLRRRAPPRHRMRLAALPGQVHLCSMQYAHTGLQPLACGNAGQSLAVGEHL